MKIKFVKCTKLFLIIMIMLSGLNFSVFNSYAENVLSNGGFESGNLDDWQVSNPDKFKITNQPENVYEGNYALEINSSTQVWESVMRKVSTQPNHKYEISFFSKGTNNVIFKILNAEGNISLIDKKTNNDPEEWTKYTYEFGTKTNEQVVLYFSDTIGEVYIDNISLEDLGEVPLKQYGVLNGDFETGDLSYWSDIMANNMFSVVDGNGGKVLTCNSPTQDWSVYLTQTIDLRRATEYIIEMDKDGADVYYKLVSTDWAITLAEGTADTQNFQTYASQPFYSSSHEQAILIIYSANGTMYLDNIKLSPFVIESDHSRGVVNATGTETDFSLVDNNATNQTKSLFSYLKEVGKEYLIFGQQNNNTQAIVRKDGIVSDTYHTVGAYAGISGFDVIDIRQDFNGYLDKVKSAHGDGSIITVCDHMPNFSAPSGSGAWTDMTPTIEHIFPGGKDNQAFTNRLDIMADFANQAIDSEGNKIPIIFRPFHENSGMWFWWGVTNTTKDQFVNLWRYTVEYLRDEKGVDNFLYAYSPNGHFASEEEYLSRYPGDAYVDIIGFDIYHDNPSYESNWMNQVKKDSQIAVNIAKDRNKVAAITEIGLRYNGNDGLAVEENAMKDWFTVLHDTLMNDPIAKEIAYMMTWRNHDKDHFWVPYDDGEGDRHEMANDFTKLYNLPDVIFADRIGNVGELMPTVIPKEENLYIMTPTLGEKIAGEYTLRIGFSGKKEQLSGVRVKINNQEYETTLNGLYFEVKIDTNTLEDSNYELVATSLDGTYQVNKMISILNNPENEQKDITIIDNFDTYFGDDSLLNEAYNRNSNGDQNALSLIPSPFSKTRSNEDYALRFNYSVTTGGPGYSGTSKALNYDITSLDAKGISLWFQGDGQEQDILIQLSAPNTFEAHLNEVSTFDKTALTPQFIEIPWSAFRPKGHADEMDFSNIQSYAIYVNGTGVDNSTLIFDDIQFIYEKQVSKTDISQAQVIVPEVIFNGEVQEPEVKVLLDDVELVKGIDYLVSYENNKNAGAAKVTVSGQGKYEGEKSQTFQIMKAKHTIDSPELLEMEYQKNGIYQFNIESTSNTLVYSLLPSSQDNVVTLSEQGKINMINPGKVKIGITAPEESNYEKTTVEVSLVLNTKKKEVVNVLPTKSIPTGDNTNSRNIMMMGLLSVLMFAFMIFYKTEDRKYSGR